MDNNTNKHSSVFFSNLSEIRDDIPISVLLDILQLDNLQLNMDIENDFCRLNLIKQLSVNKNNKIDNLLENIINSLFPTIYNEIIFLYPLLFSNIYIPISYIYLSLDNMYGRKFMMHVDMLLDFEYKNNISTRFSKVLYYYIPILFKYRYINIYNKIITNSLSHDKCFNMKVYDIFLRFNFNPDISKLALHQIEGNVKLDIQEYYEHIQSNYPKFRYYHYVACAPKYLNYQVRVNRGFNNGLCYAPNQHAKYVKIISHITQFNNFITYFDDINYMIMSYKEWYEYFNTHGFIIVNHPLSLENYKFENLIKTGHLLDLTNILNLNVSKILPDEQKYSSLLSVLTSEHIAKMKDEISYYLYLLSVNFKFEYDMFCDYLAVIKDLILNRIDSANWIILSILDQNERKQNSNELLNEIYSMFRKLKIYDNCASLLLYENVSMKVYMESSQKMTIEMVTRFIQIANPKNKK